MATDLSAASIPRRPRAATSVLPAMVPPSASRPTRGASMASASPSHYATSPPLGISEPGITSTAQGMLRCC